MMIRQGNSLGKTPVGKAIRVVLAEAGELLGQVKAGKETAVRKRAALSVETATERYSAARAYGTAMAVVMRELVEMCQPKRPGTASQPPCGHIMKTF